MPNKQPIKLIVGLGNPGAEYEMTRHNAGAWFVEAIARLNNSSLAPHNKFHGLTGKTNIDGQETHLLVPTTFMNRSGLAVATLANFYKILPTEILIAHDELDLDPGTIRLKTGGGHGGHNGLRDIIQSIANQKNFHRLRVGIGHPGDSKKVSGFVLGKAPQTEQTLIESALDESLKHLTNIVHGDHQKVMNKLHRFDARKPDAKASES